VSNDVRLKCANNRSWRRSRNREFCAYDCSITFRQHTRYPPTPNCPPTATMGFTDFFTDAWETFAHPSPDAEVQGGTSTKSPASGTDEESNEEAEVNKQDAKKGGESQEQGHKPSSKPSDEGGDEEPEEEEEEEEVPDPKETLEKGECDRAGACLGPTVIPILPRAPMQLDGHWQPRMATRTSYIRHTQAVAVLTKTPQNAPSPRNATQQSTTTMSASSA